MNAPTVFVVDDDPAVRDGLTLLFESAGLEARAYPNAEAFLAAYDPARWGCLILDVRMGGLSGPELHAEMVRRGWRIPVIYLTGHGDIPMSVRAIKAGAADFLTKPVSGADLLGRVSATLESQRELHESHQAQEAQRRRFEELTPRESEVLQLALAGHNNKEIGRALRISFRTVEIHRSRILRKTGASNMLELAKIASSLGMPYGEAH
ncbi:MAG TPA: response regulator [Rhodocyclaceae bacterium]